MPEFNESNLCFSFKNTWQIIKVDDHSDYRSVFQTIPGTKALDFIGLHGGIIYFIEVKNYSASLTFNESKIKGDELSNALAQKFRDTLFIVLAGHHRYQRPDWQVYATAVGNGTPMRYVAWVELDYQSRNAVDQKRLKTLWSILAQKLKQKLGHLNQFDRAFHILILSSNDQNVLPDLTVYDAPC